MGYIPMGAMFEVHILYLGVRVDDGFQLVSFCAEETLGKDLWTDRLAMCAFLQTPFSEGNVFLNDPALPEVLERLLPPVGDAQFRAYYMFGNSSNSREADLRSVPGFKETVAPCNPPCLVTGWPYCG